MDSGNIDKIAKELKHHEHSISNLQCLTFIKKGYTDIKHPQIKLQMESVNKDICPFCLNQIDWDKLNTLINEHEKEIKELRQEIRDD